MRLTAAKERESARGLTLDEGLEALPDQRRAFLRAREALGFLKQSVVQIDGRAHGSLPCRRHK